MNAKQYFYQKTTLFKQRDIKQKVFALIIGIAFIITGCAPTYVPNVLNTPLLSNKGEFQAAVYSGSSGIDPQLAYAATKNIGVILNGSFESKNIDSSNNYHRHHFVELGLGYYTPIGENGRFETFGGFGYGKLRARYDNNLWASYSDVVSNRIFIQPTIGVTTEIFDGNFSTRFVMVNMRQASSSNVSFFMEPVLTGKIGFKYVKAVIQFGLSYPLSNNNLNYQPLLLSIGLQAYINKQH